ncbi:C2H2-type domain-containing protein [Aphis craccivora]|uniref:C2H2-type domain-containing protein n=1 Tax=Aphis craccivora TaxID=307492 RepID=A0A6G0VTY9_APHCR|nr:C2H2-type domain-containing protein [Aphis craccivora]
MCHLILYYTEKVKIISLETLNFRKKNFSYGLEQKNNSPPIEKHNLKRFHLKMPARQMINKLTQQSVPYLKHLIEKHNSDYVNLFQDNLKPKHHFLTHYPSIILKSGPLRHFWYFRYEAKHKELKMYARAITSRKNICLTLAKKYQYKFAHLLLNKESNQNLVVSMKYIITSSHKEFLSITYSKINYKGTDYEIGNYITNSIDEVCLYEILEIIVVQNNVSFILHQIQLNSYNIHLKAYEVDKDKSIISKSLISIEQFSSPPINIHQVPDGSLTMNFGNDKENDMFVNYVSDMENIDNPEYTELQNVVNSILTTSPCTISLVNQPVNDFDLEPNFDKIIYLSLKEKNKLKDLLEEWKMGYLLQTCVAEYVDVEALKYINSYQIAQLLHKYPLGNRIKFEHYRKNSTEKDVRNELTSRKRSTSISSILSNSSPSIPSEPIQSFLLHDILTKSVQGALITDYYGSNKNLNETCRNLLVDLIVSSLIDKQMSMSICLADRIATEITGIFPTELKIWQTSVRKEISQLSKDNKNVEKQTRVCSELDSEITVENDGEVATLLSNIQKTWPRYTKPLGYKLRLILIIKNWVYFSYTIELTFKLYLTLNSSVLCLSHPALPAFFN